jgi:hypothetical protein
MALVPHAAIRDDAFEAGNKFSTPDETEGREQ